jgi:hypothetical protein
LNDTLASVGLSYESLEALRLECDTEADAVVEQFFKEEDAGHAELFRSLAFRDAAPGAGTGAVARWLGASPADPPWLDVAAVERAQQWFGRRGGHIFCALYAGSLPTAYACHQGVEVLGLTARLETDAKRRLNETAQFMLDVMRPGGLAHGAPGFQAVRRVRLMHAAVRWLIGHDPRVKWDRGALGCPLNQEDLLLTLLTFTEVVFEVFDKTGVSFTAAEADDYLHLWSMVGHLLGVSPHALPLSRPRTTALMRHVREVHFGPSQSGKELAAALLDQAKALAPPGLGGLAASAIRWYVGDGPADMIGIPPADWTRHLFGPLASLTRVMSAGRIPAGISPAFSDWFGRGMLTLAVEAERGGDRAQFAIPTELAGLLRAKPRRR